MTREACDKSDYHGKIQKFFFTYIFFIHIYNKFLCTIYSFVKKQKKRESFDCKQCFILKGGRQNGKVLIKLMCVCLSPSCN